MVCTRARIVIAQQFEPRPSVKALRLPRGMFRTLRHSHAPAPIAISRGYPHDRPPAGARLAGAPLTVAARLIEKVPAEAATAIDAALSKAA